MPIETMRQLLERARELGPKRVAVVAADDEVALTAAAEAKALGVATPVLVGDETRIREAVAKLSKRDRAQLKAAQLVQAPEPEEAAGAAVELARRGGVDLLLKGHLRTDQLLRAVLDKQRGLRTGRLLSDVLVYEDTLSGRERLVGLTDGGVNVLPSLEEKVQIIQNAVEVFHALGFQRPKVALMSATEVVTEAIPSTVEAHAITQKHERGELELGDCEVYGPLALDNALLEWAARAKNIESPVAGRADILVVPNIEAGNLLGKAIKYFGGSICAHVILGAKVPVLIPSRVESAEDKLHSIALGVIVHHYRYG
jgi:phosphate butyryltransferase